MSIPLWRWLPRHSPKRAVTVPLAGHVIWRRTPASERAEAAGATTREVTRTRTAMALRGKGSVRVMGSAHGSSGPAARHHSDGGDRRLPEIGERVDRDAVLAQLEVEVRAGARAGAAGLADRVAGRDPLPRDHLRDRQVRVEERVAAADVDRDDVPVALVAGQPAGRRHRAAFCGPDVEGAED